MPFSHMNWESVFSLASSCKLHFFFTFRVCILPVSRQWYDSNVINAYCDFFFFFFFFFAFTVTEYVEQGLVAVNSPDNYLLSSDMGSIRHYTDSVPGSDWSN